MKAINGFTLIELLLTITILSILSILVIPSIVSTIERQQIKQFFQVFEADVLLIQNKSLGAVDQARIIMGDDNYVVRYDGQKNSIKREYPRHLTINNKINNRIMFSTNGTIIQPNTYYFKSRDTTYKVVFPLGKGRYYIEEQ